jgi:SNF2 family DNA or RNA helicase
VVGLNKGSVAQKTRKAESAVWQAQRENRPLVIVVNYDSAREEEMAAFLLKLKIGYLVMDESHRLKAPGGKTAKFAENLAKRAARRLALTGTPMPHDPLDVYSQYRALDASIYGTNFARFRNRFAVMGGYGNYQVVGFQKMEELNRLFYSIAYKAEQNVLDLPGRHHIYRYFTLGNKARKAYSELTEKLVADLDEGVVTAANALVRLLRLAQITSGWLPVQDEDGEARLVRVDEGKEDDLEDFLSDLDHKEPVVHFCRFQSDLDMVHRVSAKLGRGSRELSGRRHELEEWQGDTDGKFPDLAVQIQAGGVGIDLTRSHYGVYISKDFSLGNYDQTLARQDRPGQVWPVTFVHLMAEGTVDEQIMKALEERRNVVESVLVDMGVKNAGMRSIGFQLATEATQDALGFAGMG